VIAVPLVLLGLVVAHIIALHEVGSNNPDGIEIKANKDANGVPLDGIPFHPYYSAHDLMGVGAFLLIFSAVIFFFPEVGGYFLEHNNFIPADPLKTPPHIAPVWYFTPFYSMLRATTSSFLPVLWLFFAVLLGMLFLRTKSLRVKGIAIAVAVLLAAGFYFIEAKFWGVVVMGGSVVILFFMPWLDHSPVKSIRYRPGFHKTILAVFVVVFLVLGYLGVQPPSPVGEKVSQLGTLLYFAFFLAMPLWSRVGQFKPVPERVTFKHH
jgi:ubiquinol-cytochrome c reductase cytochrome b subunit